MPRKQPASLHLGLVASLALASISTGCGGSSTSIDANTALTGSYGGTSADTARQPATLQLTATGGQLNLPCNYGFLLTQPLVTDGSGHFSIPGTVYSSLIGGPNVIPVTLTGTASGDTITVTVINGTSQTTEGTYTVVKGKDAPASTGPCAA